jgi:hypothetical protein
VLRRFAKNKEGDVIPTELVKKLKLSDTLTRAMDTQYQLLIAQV